MMTENMNKPTRKRINKEWGIEEERYRRTAPDAPGARRKFRKRDSLPIIFAIAVMALVAVLGWKVNARAEGEGVVLTVENWTYGDAAEIPSLSVDGVPTVPYEISYLYDNTSSTVPQNAGTHTVTATYKLGSGDESSYVSADFTISKRPLSETVITLSNDQLTYNGSAQAPTVTVSINGVTVDPSDYTVSGSGTNAGTTHKLTLTANANGNLSGSAFSDPYTISPAPLNIVDGISIEDKVYNGEVNDAVISHSAISVSDANDTNDTVIEGLTFTVSGTGTYDDAAVGDNVGVTVNANNLVLEGAGSNNYAISGIVQTGITGNITPKPVTVTGILAVDREYAENDKSATLDFRNISITGAAAVDGTEAELWATGTGEFENDAVGRNKIVNISGVELTGTSAGNYTLTSSPSTARATIFSNTAPTVNITGSYVYNGTDITPTYAVTVGSTQLVKNDDYIEVLTNNINAGTATLTIKPIINTPIYRFEDVEETFEISKAPVTACTVELGSPLTYNRSEQTQTVNKVSVGDVRLDNSKWSIAKDDENHDTNKATDAGDYTMTITISNDPNVQDGSITKTFTIDPKEVTVTGIVATPKTYDGTNAITLDASHATISGIIAGDTLSATATGHLTLFSVGEDRPVTIDNIVLDGSSKDNYVVDLSGSQTETTATINPIEITPSVTVASATYTGAGVEPEVTVISSGTTLTTSDYSVIYSNNVNAASSSDTNAPTVVVSPREGGNYTFSPVTQHFTINKKTVTVSGITAHDKDYDRTDSVVLDYSGTEFTGMATGDSLTVTATGRFTNYNAGTGRPVAISGLVLGGTSINNYILASSGNQTNATATINPIEVTVPSGITARDKAYDGNATATLNCSAAVIRGLIEGDTVGVTATGTFDSAEVGSNKTVNISGIALTGTAKDNYTVAQNGNQTTTTASITDAILTPTITVAGGSVYDGRAKEPAVTVKLGSNTLTKDVDYTVEYRNNINAGDSAQVVVKSKAGSTYHINEETIKTFTISKCPVTVTGITARDKDYDGTSTVELDTSSVTIHTLNGSDRLTVNATGHFVNSNAGTGRQVSIDTITISGNNNYVLAANGNQTDTRAAINPLRISPVVVVTGSYTYTGKAITPTYSVTYGGTALAATDYKVTISDNKNAGEGTITVSPKTGGNYEFNDVSANFTIGRSTSLSPMPKTSITLKSSSSAKTVGDVTMSSLGVSSSKWRWSSADEGKSLVSDTTDSTSTSSSSSTSSNKTTETVTVTARLEYIGSDADNYDDSVKSVEVTITKEGSTASNKTTTTGSRTTTSSSTGTRSSTTSSRTSGSTTSSRTSGSTTSSRTGSSGSSTSSRTGSSSGSSTSSRTGSGSRTSSSSTASGANSAPEVKPPFIAGFPDVSGWDAISLRISGTAKGDSVPVYMNGTTEVPSSLLNNLKDDNVTVVFDMGNSVKWNVNGMCIPEELTSAVNFGVLTNTNTIPAELTKLISATDYNLQLSLAQDGDYGCSPILSLNLGGNNAGLHANLFKYDPATNSLSFVTADEISDDGTASLTFSEGGDYVVVVDKDILANASAHLDKPVATEEDSAPAEDEAEPVSNIAEPDSVTAYVQSQTLEENHVPKSDAIARRMVAPEVKKGVRLFWIMLLAGAAIIGGATYLLMNRQDIKARASARASKKALDKSNKSVKAIQKANNKKFKKYL